MARIAGVDINNRLKVEPGLTRIFGIGRSTARQILESAGVEDTKRIGDLNERDISAIRNYIDENLKVEGDLRKEVSLNIKRLMEINCYRGSRHKMHLPCRGQSTRSNARTRRGLAGKRGIKKK